MSNGSRLDHNMLSYVDKHQPSSDRPAANRLQRHHAASDPATPPALLETDHCSFQRGPLAAYGNRRPRLAHQYSTRLDQQHRSPFLVLNEPHRGPQPRLAQALLTRRSPGRHRAHHRRRHQATGSPDTGRSRPHPEAGYRHLADRQPLDLQPHRRDPPVRHSRSLETQRQHGNAGSQSAPSRMGFGSLPGEAHGGEGRLPGNEQRQDLQLGTQGQPDTRPESRRSVRPTRLPQPPEPQAVMLHTRRRRDGAWRLSHHARTAADGRSPPGGAQRMPTGAGTRPLLAHRPLPGAMRH